MMNSLPVYPQQESGTLLIVGPSPVVYRDIENIWQHRPGAKIAGVNEGALAAESDFLMTLHPEGLNKLLERPNNIKDGCTIHSILNADRYNQPGAELVNYWWSGETGATSTGAAIDIGLQLGFEEIILCGCPMTGADGYFCSTKESTIEDPRFGYSKHGSKLITDYQKAIKKMALNERMTNVFSMSGYTAKVFGFPQIGRFN